MSSSHGPKPAAIIAAAGQSRRMGRPKQLLSWGDGTVIEAVVNTLAAAKVAPIVCVVGHRAEQMRAALRTTPARIVYNSDYAQGEMLRSYQTGIRWLSDQAGGEIRALGGALFALSDQPHLPLDVVEQVIIAAQSAPDAVVAPSYARRRGHPIYLPRRLWPDLLALTASDTLRTLIRRHADEIVYVNASTDAVLTDIDTPEAYASLKGKFEGLRTED